MFEVKIKVFTGARKLAQLRSYNVGEIYSWPFKIVQMIFKPILIMVKMSFSPVSVVIDDAKNFWEDDVRSLTFGATQDGFAILRSFLR